MNNTGAFVVSLGFVAFAALLLYILFDSPGYEEVTDTVNSQVTTLNDAFGVPAALVTETAPSTAQPPVLPPYVSPTIALSEGHWQGMEVIVLTTELRTKLKIPMNIEGVLIDEATLNVLESGVMAGDILVAIDQKRVKTIEDVVKFSKSVRDRTSVSLSILRNFKPRVFTLKSKDFLGFAQAETAPMILPSDIVPHPYRGKCTLCHAIGGTGDMKPDPDLIPLPVPTILKNAQNTHRDRGPCTACHVVL
ncbi:PDZ domain-containing protein [Deltaproteobacteria bacterium TL4]